MCADNTATQTIMSTINHSPLDQYLHLFNASTDQLLRSARGHRQPSVRDSLRFLWRLTRAVTSGGEEVERLSCVASRSVSHSNQVSKPSVLLRLPPQPQHCSVKLITVINIVGAYGCISAPNFIDQQKSTHQIFNTFDTYDYLMLSFFGFVGISSQSYTPKLYTHPFCVCLCVRAWACMCVCASFAVKTVCLILCL